MNVTIVVNPHAGKQNILREISAVEKVFRDGGCEVATVQTETREQAKGCWRTVRKSRMCLSAAAGTEPSAKR